jgi:hypothetical protein
MFGRGGSDLLTLPMGEEQVKEAEYLSVLSPKDKLWEPNEPALALLGVVECRERRQRVLGGAPQHELAVVGF